MVRLPQEARAQLQELAQTLLQPGDIYALPPQRVIYRGDAKFRPCMVVALEGEHPGVRAHLVPGTSQRASGPAVVITRDEETDLLLRTEFDFSASFALPVSVVVGEGKLKGRLAQDRLPEITAAILRSDRVALKRLVSS